MVNELQATHKYNSNMSVANDLTSDGNSVISSEIMAIRKNRQIAMKEMAGKWLGTYVTEYGFIMDEELIIQPTGKATLSVGVSVAKRPWGRICYELELFINKNTIGILLDVNKEFEDKLLFRGPYLYTYNIEITDKKRNKHHFQYTEKDWNAERLHEKIDKPWGNNIRRFAALKIGTNNWNDERNWLSTTFYKHVPLHTVRMLNTQDRMNNKGI